MKFLDLLIAVLILLIVGRVEITFSPFSISMPGWRECLAYIFLALSIILFKADANIEGYREGAMDNADSFFKVLEKKANEGNNKQLNIGDDERSVEHN